MLKRMCREQPKEWPRFINLLLFAYREVPQSSTRFSLFELVYGHSVRGPLSLLKDLWESHDEDIGDETRATYEYAINLRERFQGTCKMAQQELEKSRDSYQSYYDRHARDRMLTPGQQVLLLLPTSNNKLLAEWKGPYDVIERANKWNYVIRVGEVDCKFHINNLKQYHNREGNQVHGEMVAARISVAVIQEEVDDDGIQSSPNYKQTEGIADVVISKDLTSSLRNDIKRILFQHQSVFSDVPGKTDPLNHSIKLKSDTPIRSKPYPIPFSMQKDLEEDLQHMLEPSEWNLLSPHMLHPSLLLRRKTGPTAIA